MVKSIDFDRFITREGTDTLSLAITSKTGKSEDIFRHFIGIIPD